MANQVPSKSQPISSELVQLRLKQKDKPIHKRSCSRLLKNNSFNQVFFAKHPPYEIELAESQPHLTSLLLEIKLLCESICDDKNMLPEFIMKKCCQLYFSQAQKQMLNRIICDQFPLAEEGQLDPNAGAIKFFDLLAFVVGGNRDDAYD